MKRYERYKPTGIAWLPEIPEHWDCSKIKSHFRLRSTKVSDKDYLPLSVSKNGITPQMEAVAKTDNGDNRKLVLKGDFVVNSRSDRKGSCGVSGLDGSVSLINIVLRPIDGLEQYYHHLFRSHNYIEEFYRNGRGIVADLWTTRWNEMGGIMIPFPPIAEQKKIVAFLDKRITLIEDCKCKRERELQTLNELRQAEIASVVTRGLNPDVPMKDSGIPWIGQIPAHWDVKRLSGYVNFFKGLPITKADLIPEGIPVISYGQIHSKDNATTTLKDSLFRFVSPEYKRTNPQCLLRKYDFVFADTSEDYEGAGNFVLNDRDEDIFAGYHTIVARLKNDTITPAYLAHLLNSLGLRHQIRSSVDGVKVFTISRHIIKSARIIIPPVNEQIDISNYIDGRTRNIDTMIEALKAEIDRLTEYKQRLISDVVTGQVNVQNEKV